jgi:hypothetical protein
MQRGRATVTEFLTQAEDEWATDRSYRGRDHRALFAIWAGGLVHVYRLVDLDAKTYERARRRRTRSVRSERWRSGCPASRSQAEPDFRAGPPRHPYLAESAQFVHLVDAAPDHRRRSLLSALRSPRWKVRTPRSTSGAVPAFTGRRVLFQARGGGPLSKRRAAPQTWTQIIAIPRPCACGRREHHCPLLTSVPGKSSRCLPFERLQVRLPKRISLAGAAVLRRPDDGPDSSASRS